MFKSKNSKKYYVVYNLPWIYILTLFVRLLRNGSKSIFHMECVIFYLS